MSHPGFRIKALWAFVMVGPDDEEGACGFKMPDGTWMPMIAADETRLDLIRSKAQELADISGRTIQIIRLDHRTDVGVIEPKPREGAS